MGTNFFYDEFHEASDKESVDIPDNKRQVEIFTESGTFDIHLRISELGSQHMGDGYSVKLSDKEAKDLLDGLKGALQYKGVI